MLGGSHQTVVGIGNVEIPVWLPSKQSGEEHGIIRIDDVLHAPTAICNIMGMDVILNRYNVRFGRGKPITDHEGRIAGYFDEEKKLFCLKLSGPPVGPVTTSSLFLRSENSNTAHYINAQWEDSERMSPFLRAATKLMLLTLQDRCALGGPQAIYGC